MCTSEFCPFCYAGLLLTLIADDRTKITVLTKRHLILLSYVKNVFQSVNRLLFSKVTIQDLILKQYSEDGVLLQRIFLLYTDLSTLLKTAVYRQ